MVGETVLERVKQALGASGLSIEAAHRLTQKEWLLELDRHVLSDSDLAFLADLTGFSFSYLLDGTLRELPSYVLKRLETYETYETKDHNHVVWLLSSCGNSGY